MPEAIWKSQRLVVLMRKGLIGRNFMVDEETFEAMTNHVILVVLL